MKPSPRDGVLAIDAYVPGKSAAARTDGARVFKLSANETPLGPSPHAIEAARRAAESIAEYPEGSARALREAIGARHGLDPRRIIAGAGSDQILELLALAYVGPGDEGIYSQYGFLEYRIVILAAGGVPKVAPETNYVASVDALLAQVTERTKIVFLANPNNPTGSYLSNREIERLADALPPRALLVLDSAYAEYVQAEDYDSGLRLAGLRDNVVMTRTFSKIYGLAGLRLGWGYGPAHVIDTLNRIRSPFNVSSLASAAGIAALADSDHLKAATAHNARWLPWLSEKISDLGLEALPSVGNFIAIRFPDSEGRRAADADRFLTRRGLVLRAIGAYGMPQFLRLTVGCEEANARVVAAIGDFLRGADA
ncbi:histidinol-phosphate transaminase [Methylocystis bryophila]|uniref:Histidinol-phosphate aminotransferase n=1 Tax=Methylocystis bryophila TaxID=655015 RepID=A0A1W6MY48_9HYPH|nr:histidinol-phosphate transaminase [Methylocystis bryophila]ARN82514.1 histidinol-phosphate transaminase [Methylocystis bryophila]BDV38713.1 histidinol-phosphate aminotransferase [Methylocystis bryophila]